MRNQPDGLETKPLSAALLTALPTGPVMSSTDSESTLQQFTGYTLLLTLFLIASSPWTTLPLIWPALLLWLSFLVNWMTLPPGPRKQSLILLSVGLAGIGWGLYQLPQSQYHLIPWQQALTANTGLLGMLLAVSFLSLITTAPGKETEQLPTGKSALKRTLMGIHLFGSVINLSIVFIMGDRFAAAARHQNNNTNCLIQDAQMKVLSRGFCSAALWSPFFAAVAVALTYAPGASLLKVMQAGIPLALIALIITYIELRPEARHFTGYPMQARNLLLPGFLAIMVLSCHWYLPHYSVMQVISVLSPATAIIILMIRRTPDRPVLRQLSEHSQNRLARMGSEIALFLAAGTMAAGLSMLFYLYGHLLPIPDLTPIVVSLLLLVMLILSLIGVHPLISIATISGILVPTDPPMDLLAMIFLASWGIGTACSPLSGMNLSLRGRYLISANRVLIGNLCYGIMMWIAASLSLWIYNPL